ncbi:MAG: acylphosphatase [Patescibacteria group bacterium]
MPSVIRFHIEIEGKVQGVFFRHTAQKIAQSLGLTGWVKNAGEKVICEAQGEQVLVEQFILFALHGPRLSTVEKVLLEPMEPFAREEEFSIVDAY